jgi:hypothetical protein
VVLVCAVLVAGACTAGDGQPAAIEQAAATSTATTATLPPARAVGATIAEPAEEPVWVVGATPLPLRPDGLGEILPTPEVLVDRGLLTTDVLAPPSGEGFESMVVPIDDAILARMGPTWSSGCPVPVDDLRYVTVSFWGFDGEHHTGELVLHRDAADDVVWVFEQLHAARFPIEEMRLITGADLDAPPTGDGNNTASFVCRPVRGGSSWSEHARGLAVDINPFHNPYRRGDVVLPELASTYLDRGWHRPGMIQPGDVVTEAFAAIGWTWGGDWSSPDYMHFSANGR